MRIFNTTGPVRADDHYYLPPLTRFNLDEIEFLIDQKKYFILHAPRQVGKTSAMLALMEYLNVQGTYQCLYVNVEAARAARGNWRGDAIIPMGAESACARLIRAIFIPAR